MFTSKEWEIIKHRLEVPDAISECLGEEGHNTQLVWENCDILLMTKGKITFEDLLPLEKEIIIDCCEGSTFFCDMEDAVALGELTKSQSIYFHKSADLLEKLLKVSIPRG